MAFSSRSSSPELVPERLRTKPPANLNEIIIVYIKVNGDDDFMILRRLIRILDGISNKETYMVYDGRNFEQIGCELAHTTGCLLLKHDCAQNGIPNKQQLATISSISNSNVCRVLMEDAAIYEFADKLKKVPLVVNFNFPENSEILIKRMSLAGKDETYNEAIVLFFVRNDNQLNILKKIQKKYNVPVLCDGTEVMAYLWQNHHQE